MSENDTAQPEAGMFLRSLELQHFRGCYETTIDFQPDLTLLVGENNSGKSTVIDALRLATTPLSRRRTRYFEPEDFTDGVQSPIQLVAKYAGLTKIQRGRSSAALDLVSKIAWYGTRCDWNEEAPRRGRVALLSGSSLSPDPEPEVRDRINHVYLEPLRNAQRELDSSTGTRLAAVIRDLIDEPTRKDFVGEANSRFRQLETHQLITDTTKRIQEHVTTLTDALSAHTVGIGFHDYTLHRLVGGLRLKMAEMGLDPSDIANSGSGYANLVYMATVILELRKAQDSELTLFLVEEPEAHLHPQLQAVLLGYLTDQAKQSTRDDRSGPAGRIQVIATTHSPNIASSAGTKHIVVLKKQKLPVSQTGAEPTINCTKALPLARLDLTPSDRRKLDQYLDVTKAELLFAQRPILVEGISEAVLLPIIGSHNVYPTDSEKDRHFRRILRGVSILPIGSVDFKPYIRLLIQPFEGVRLVNQLVIVTDRDPAVKLGRGNGEDDEKTYNRKADLIALARSIGSSDHLEVCESNFTLEADLMTPLEANGPVLKAAFLAQKRRSQAFWTELEQNDDPSEFFYQKLRKTARFIQKGEFAHDIAERIRNGESFQAPPYLVKAIRVAVGQGSE